MEDDLKRERPADISPEKWARFEDLKRRLGHVCQCGYHSQDTGNGHTADYWHHMMVVHGVNSGAEKESTKDA